MLDKPTEILDIEDILVDIFDTIVQYDSGKLSQNLALKNGLNIIEGLKSIDEYMYQEIKHDLINTIKGKS